MGVIDSITSLFSSSSSSSSSSDSSSSSSSSESVFGDSYHYIPTAKSLLYDSDFRQKTYFQLGDASSSSSTSSGSSNNSLSGLLTSNSSSSSSSSSTSTAFADDDFWELILTQYEETHTEKFTPYNTLSEAFMWFATGPMPVEVNLTGMLMMSGSSDYRTKFLYNYTSAFRAKQLSANDKTLTLVVKDTTMKLLLKSISLNESSESPDFVGISMSGCGYKYQNVNSSEELYKGFYGTEAAVATSSASSASSAKKEESSSTTTTSSSSSSASTIELPGGTALASTK